MHVDVRVAAEADELRSLHHWLRADTDVRRSSSLTLQEQPPEPGQMGGLVDVIQLVTDNGWSAASFVVALAAWKRTRPQDPQIEIRRGNTVVVLTQCDDDEINRVIRALDTPAENEDEAPGT
ncbi:effector-associated constant component EACC1 [Streptomyces erythrochromogenes]|uniref:effector-associated constant component EACC1 n=1 Tax=Streptomyces erythrochromogenes TaxID=285574 RepID=UPI00380BBB89